VMGWHLLELLLKTQHKGRVGLFLEMDNNHGR
jgi:hypothetical protein